MSRRVTISGNHGSMIASGDNASIQGTINYAVEGADAGDLRRELADLLAELGRYEPTPAVLEAQKRVGQLDGVLEDGAGPEQVRTGWGRVQAAMSALGVVANMAQIGQLVEALLT